MDSTRNVTSSNRRYLWAIGAMGVALLVTLALLGYRAEAMTPMIPCLILLAYSFLKLVDIVRGSVTSPRPYTEERAHGSMRRK